MYPLSEQTKKALRLLHESGYEAYIVGGCVRDYLLGMQPKDIDITTNAEPPQIKSVFAAFQMIDTGLKHGTVTVLIDGTPFEITTYRVDLGYSDGRHPDAVRFTRSLYEDAARRDFTMNALAYNEEEGLIDSFGGAARRSARCCGRCWTRSLRIVCRTSVKRCCAARRSCKRKRYRTQSRRSEKLPDLLESSRFANAVRAICPAQQRQAR